MKKCLPTLLAAALALGLAACGQQTDSKAASDNTSQAAGEQIKLSSKAGDISIPANVSKIAVMDYTSLDTIVALGASDKVIGLPLSSAVPTSLASFKDGKYADFGAVNNVNLEKLAAAQPQLVISADRLQKQTDALKQIAPTYHYSIDTNNYWQSFHEQTLNLAKIVGKTSEAEQKLKALDEEAAKLSEKTKGKTALIVLVNNDKLMAFGQHSRFGLIHDKLASPQPMPASKLAPTAKAFRMNTLLRKTLTTCLSSTARLPLQANQAALKQRSTTTLSNKAKPLKKTTSCIWMPTTGI